MDAEERKLFEDILKENRDAVQKVNTLTTVILGVPDSDNRGLVGDIKRVVETITTDHSEILLIKARCLQIHGVLNNGPKSRADFPIPRGRLIGILTGFAFFAALVIYDIGSLLGVWPKRPPS